MTKTKSARPAEGRRNEGGEVGELLPAPRTDAAHYAPPSVSSKHETDQPARAREQRNSPQGHPFASTGFSDEDAVAQARLTAASSYKPRSNSPPLAPQSRGALSVNAFCAWAGIGRSKFYAEVRAGRIRVRKLGKRTLITMSDAQAWLDGLPEAE